MESLRNLIDSTKTEIPEPLRRSIGKIGRRQLRSNSWKVIASDRATIFTSSAEKQPSIGFATLSNLHDNDTVLDSIINIVGQQLLAIPGVQSVYIDIDKELTTLSVWTILGRADEVSRKRVYKTELELIDEFPVFVFNFRTTDQAGEDTPSSAG